MRYYRTQKDLDLAVKQNKPERVLRILWLDVQKGIEFNKFLNDKKEEYKTTYPELDENNELIEYLIYRDMKEEEVFNPEIGEVETKTIYIFDDECYETKEVEDENNPEVIKTIKVLKEECQALLDAGKVKPTEDLFLKLAIEKYEEPELDMNEYLTFIKEVFIENINKLADEKTDKAEAYVAGKTNLTTQQVKRYMSKATKAQEAKDTDDYTVFLVEVDTIDEAKVLVDTILELAENWKKLVDEYNTLIDGFRVKANKIVSSINDLDELNKVTELLTKANNLAADTTVEKIRELFTEYTG